MKSIISRSKIAITSISIKWNTGDKEGFYFHLTLSNFLKRLGKVSFALLNDSSILSDISEEKMRTWWTSLRKPGEEEGTGGSEPVRGSLQGLHPHPSHPINVLNLHGKRQARIMENHGHRAWGITGTRSWGRVCRPGPWSPGAARGGHFHAGRWKAPRTPRALLDTAFLYLEVMLSCLESEKERAETKPLSVWLNIRPEAKLAQPCASAGAKRVGGGNGCWSGLTSGSQNPRDSQQGGERVRHTFGKEEI